MADRKRGVRASSAIGVVIVVAMAAVGVWLGVDALEYGGLLRYRLFGLVFGAAWCLPLALWPFRRRPLLRRIVFALVPLLGVLVLLEVLLRVTGVGADWESVLVADERLGHGLAPGHGGIDARGFRNAAVPDRVDVLFVGDSLTYGFGVAADGAIPQQVAARSGLSVYNAGIGGYGPIQYREVARMCHDLQPADIVIGLFFGNDVIDAFRFAWLPGAADLRRAGVDYPPRQPVGPTGRPPNRAMRWFEGITGASRLLSVGATVVRDRLRDTGALYEGDPDAPRVDAGPVSTQLWPQHCLPPDALTNPTWAEGVRLTGLCLRDLGKEGTAAGARVWLLLLPTKEAVYQRWLVAEGRGVEVLRDVPGIEGRVRDLLVAEAVAAGVRVIDPEPRLRAALAAGRPMWPPGPDPHPGADGYAEIAQAVADALVEERR